MKTVNSMLSLLVKGLAVLCRPVEKKKTPGFGVLYRTQP